MIPFKAEPILMISCDDDDEDDGDDDDVFLVTYHPFFWPQPPQLALVIHLLHQIFLYQDTFPFQNSHSRA